MPWGVAAAGIGLAGSVMQGNAAAGTTKDSIRASNQSARLSAEEARRAKDTSRALLAPYYGREMAASNQLMAQLGMGGGGGGGGGGYSMGGQMGGLPALPGMRDETLDQRYIDELQEQIAAKHKQDGRGDSASLQASAKETRALLAQMKQSGDLPSDFYIPGENALRGPDRWKQLQSMTTGRWGKSTAYDAEGDSLPQYMGMGGEMGGEAQMGGPGGMPDDRRTFMPDGSPTTGPAGGIETVRTISDRAGLVGPGADFQEQYYADLEGDTPQFGMNFKDNPVYQAMIDENMRNVNQSAANTGSLYSGRRGEALRDTSAATQMAMYQDLANREERAYEQDLMRRGNAVGSAQGREDAYYNNYMSMLQGLSNPDTATNLANLESGHAATQAGIRGNATQQANAYNIAGTGANNAMIADISSGLGDLAVAWGNRGPSSSVPASANFAPSSSVSTGVPGSTF